MASISFEDLGFSHSLAAAPAAAPEWRAPPPRTAQRILGERDESSSDDDDDASVDTSAGRQLFEAALAGKLELVETLLRDHGQPVGGTDSDSHSAAAAAPGGGAADDGTPFLSWVNKWTESALHIAADRGHAAIVRRLLRAGAEVNTQNVRRRENLFLFGPHGLVVSPGNVDAWALVDEILRHRAAISDAFRGTLPESIALEIASFAEPPGGGCDDDSDDYADSCDYPC